MKVSRVVVPIALLSVTLTGCLSVPVAENAAQLTVDWQWSEKSGCTDVSPAITVGNVPAATKYLRIRMSDLDKPTFSHGGGEVAYTGDKMVPEGALNSYYGPCPPSGAHRYEFVVRALNAEKNLVLGEGKNMRRYPE
ncbi:MAG: phospholipid-binding protein [Gammaproteobacteria bacterium]|nr:phospholipid-binding protein [Gammaproteobacteria bacterium]